MGLVELKLQYSRLKLSTQIQCRWHTRKTKQMTKLLETIKTSSASMKKAEREMIELEIKIKEKEGKIIKLTMGGTVRKVKETPAMSADQARVILGKMSKEEVAKLIANMK